MRKILSRLDRLEKSSKNRQIEFHIRLEEESRLKNYFHNLNQFMEADFPGHGWSKLSLKEKWKVYTNPDPPKKLNRPDCPIPKIIPSDNKNEKLYVEALRLHGDNLWERIEQRRSASNEQIGSLLV